MFTKKETPYYKKYYLFGKCVWKRQKAVKQLSEYLLSKISDICVGIVKNTNGNIAQVDNKLKSGLSELNSQIQEYKNISDSNTEKNRKHISKLNEQIKSLNNFVSDEFNIIQKNLSDSDKKYSEKIQSYYDNVNTKFDDIEKSLLALSNNKTDNAQYWDQETKEKINNFIGTASNEFTQIKQKENNIANDIDAVKAKIDYIQKIFPIYLAAQIEHTKIFPKYKNCNQGKDMVLLASGPTLDDYTAQKNVLFMGVNKSFMANKADLDYLFVQDFIPDTQDKIDAYKGNNCKKFYGMHYLVPGIAQSYAEKANAERYYFVDINWVSPWPFPVDCSTMPFNTYSSVAHPAAVFALWTGVKKLYLVGCDTNMSGYFGKESKNYLCVDNVMYGWQKFKEFAATWYPETEIISVNPVGLRGLFHDVYTKSYLDKHPEIAKTNPEILK